MRIAIQGRKLYIVIGLGLVCAAAAIAGYQKYKEISFANLISPNVKNVSIRIDNSVSMYLEEDTKITWKECFEKLESNISEVDKQAIEIQSKTENKNNIHSVVALDYIRQSQIFFRSLNDCLKKMMRASSSIERFKRSTSRIESRNPYLYEYEKKNSDEAAFEMNKALNDAKKARKDLGPVAGKLIDVYQKANGIFSVDILFDLDKIKRMKEQAESEPL